MQRPKERPRLDLLAAIEGHYASEIVVQLVKLGIFTRLNEPSSAQALARSLGVRPDVLGHMLEFLARTTNIIERHGDLYRLGTTSPMEVTFQFEKFIRAYGISIRNLHKAFSDVFINPPVNKAALASAFAAVADAPSIAVAKIRDSGSVRLLDLACGPASLLIEMAKANADFYGVGIDSSNTMCRSARSRARSAGVEARVQIHQADVRDVGGVLDSGRRRKIDTLYGRSVLNAFFGQDDAAVSFLREIRRCFPGRAAFFVDYYGEMNRPPVPNQTHRLAQLQDLAQLASGQGIPPSDHETWNTLYERAGCRVISIDNFRAEGIRWFIHKVQC